MLIRGEKAAGLTEETVDEEFRGSVASDAEIYSGGTDCWALFQANAEYQDTAWQEGR
jgi:hypothetical protein